MAVRPNEAGAGATTQHPSYPREASILGFAANEWSAPQLMAVFACAAGAVVVAAYRAAAARCPRRLDRFAAAWFALCGGLHVAFEGYYVLNRTFIAGQQTLAAQLWKEYALSDSRYLTSDIFTVCVESFTVLVWGPLCWLTVVATLGRWPARHGLQLVVCTAHLYGVGLYYATNWAEHRATGRSSSRPEFLYYWIYYVGLNMPWVVVPSVFLYDGFVQISRASAALNGKLPRGKAE